MNDRERYMAAAHAVQSGAATWLGLEQGPALRNQPGLADELGRALKHLRTGIDTAKVEHGALVQMLVARGLFTEAEYLRAIADAMEAEVKRYEVLLTERLGSPVTLA